MANEQFAFLRIADVPSRDAWQKTIDESGIDFQLHPELDPITNVGYVPCTLAGSEAGCEMYFDDSPGFLAAFGEMVSGRDCCITFRWGGSMRECASGMIASYALAKDFGAVVTYEGEAPYEDIDLFLSWAKETVEDALKE